MTHCGFTEVMCRAISWPGHSYFLEFLLVAWQPHGNDKTHRHEIATDLLISLHKSMNNDISQNYFFKYDLIFMVSEFYDTLKANSFERHQLQS